MKRSLFLVLLILSTLSRAQAQNRCLDFFSSQKVIQRWMPEAQTKLPEFLVERLKQHSIFLLAQSLKDRGRHLQFVFRGSFLKNFKQSPGVKGEGQQALLIKKYVEFLFPEATTVSQPVDDFDKPIPPAPDKKQIQLYVLDRGEYPTPPQSADPKVILDMAVLKAGNPGLVTTKKSELRAQLGIPERAKVLSLYVKNERIFYQHSTELLRTVRKAFDFDVLILSLAVQWEPGEPTRLVDLQRGAPLLSQFITAKSLSSLRETELSSRENIFIFNDTVGWMPQVHALADLAVVVGPINFMQPLNVGTRTLLWSNSELRGTYQRAVLDELVSLAQNSGGLAVSESLTEMPGRIYSLLDGPEPVSPALQKMGDRAPLRRF